MSLVGKQAPDFNVQGFYKGEMRQFVRKDFSGKWVYLLFYPLDFTFVCPTEVLKFSEAAADFRERNCEVLGVSVDSQFSHKAWVESKLEDGGLGGDLDFPLLADINKQMARNYDVLLEDEGVALRGLFLINPEGVIVQQTTNFLPVGRSAKEAMRLLKAFQFVAENGDQVCPADWQEGDDTMLANPQGMREFLATNG